MSRFQTLFLVIAVLFFALVWTLPVPGPEINPPTPGGLIQVTAPSAGTYKFGSWQGVSWNANVDIPDKWNRTVNVYIAKKCEDKNKPDQLTYKYLGEFNYGNTYAGFQAELKPGTYFGFVVVCDDPFIWGTGPEFSIVY
ncbi:4594_t:CDS:2 [Ambispora leptoticha]|uniref:4594_t:CDS:1 n=1 Tax=Ambispora leptoticha TaxID=144679 RepID=A0A9N8ZT82_9GLOM|nr:4594_t:CDS:2 [Ambispora leptoticha]